MSYLSDALAHKLREAGPAARFNILSAILPVITSVKAFKTIPSSDVTYKILGIPLKTVVDEYDLHVQHRTPVVTAWAGEAGARGVDVFGACKLDAIDGGMQPSWNMGGNDYAQFDHMWFNPRTTYPSQGAGGAALAGDSLPYLRAGSDGFFFAAGHRRAGNLPWASATEPLGDNQNSTPANMIERGRPGYYFSAGPRLSVIAADQTHTFGPNTVGFAQTALASVGASSVAVRGWTAYSIRGYGATAEMYGLTKIQNVVSPATAGWTAVDLSSSVNVDAGRLAKSIAFGRRWTATTARYDSGTLTYGAIQFLLAQPDSQRWSELGGFYFGRRALDAADMQKLYYSPSTTACIWLAPWQNPVRAMGYLDQMSVRQASKLIDAIVAGSIDPQTDTPAAVWDAVR